MKILKTVHPSHHEFIRFLTHKNATFRLFYRAIYNGVPAKHTAVDARVRASVLGTNGWVDIADSNDIEYTQAPRPDSHSDEDDSAARSEIVFKALQEHIELLYAEKVMA